jgi:hypothetical protein
VQVEVHLASRDHGADMFALLAFYWAVAIDAHQGHGEIVRPTASVLLTLAATALLVRSSSVPLLLCTILGQFLDVALHWPPAFGSWLLFAVAGLWLLLGSGMLALKEKRLPTPAEVYTRHAPGLRWLLLLGYAAMIVAKLDAVAGAADYARVLVEAGILLLLCLRRTRMPGLLVGSVYHIALGVSGPYDFSAVVLALYIPFLGDDFAARMHAVLARVPAAARAYALWLRIAHARATLPLLLLLALALAFVPSLLGVDPRLAEQVSTQTYRLLWLDPAGLLPMMLLAVWWNERPRPAP